MFHIYFDAITLWFNYKSSHKNEKNVNLKLEINAINRISPTLAKDGNMEVSFCIKNSVPQMLFCWILIYVELWPRSLQSNTCKLFKNKLYHWNHISVVKVKQVLFGFKYFQAKIVLGE